MLRHNTPVENHLSSLGLLVKREDLSCPPPGPPFSKTRGVYAHIEKRSEKIIGVLDTYHSQGGQAVAAACHLLGKQCVNYYPEYKYEPGYREPQEFSLALGAKLVGLPAGRSAVLYHGAKKHLRENHAEGTHYMMPNALKLPEMVEETAKEVMVTLEGAVTDLISRPVLISVSSATIAAGVIRGFAQFYESQGASVKTLPQFLLHMGYSRSRDAIQKYISVQHGVKGLRGDAISLIDEGYNYKDKSKNIIDLPFPANHYYDMKAINWWNEQGRERHGEALLWLIG